ncbi:histone-lysine N-methyltransferase 2C isoform X4 [Pleurodeles waltl]|uniref:histone-lysine N-methyltransferase 2C isoform X4 n=1 Tax=Pleurodeles waltl TaxID=8319 RepID=UPI00370963A9
MSSEADPSSLERGPPSPPPVAAVSDKRPRGRPRKDGAPPVQRSRRKPRSRGKTTLEDDDSMDGQEAAETENTVQKTVEAGTLADIKEKCGVEERQTVSDTKNQQELTLAFEHSLPEKSAVPVASVDVETQTSEKCCAFCYCGERSFLGQGELKQFSPTPEFISTWKSQSLKNNETSRSVETCNISNQNVLAHRQRGQSTEHERSPHHSIVSCTTVSTQTVPEETTSKFWDELSQVGLPDDMDIQALFEPTGHCWAHHRCAEWSQEVCQTEDHGLVNVDKAVVSGSTERCAYCKHFGATIRCCGEKCLHTYHYPCAAGAGTFQDFSHFSLLCPEHIDQAPERSKEDANCAVCDSFGDLSDQLFCTTCGQHYHGMCLDVAVTPLKRAGWQCPDCKVCQNCKQSGEDNMMLVCDTCDKGYHTFCLQPIMDSVPTNGWKCKNCRICSECSTRTSSQWHHNCLVCDSCYQQHENLPCPFCEKSYHPDLRKDMLRCQMCKRWIHTECDNCTISETDSLYKEAYICTMCKQLDGGGEEMESCTETSIPEMVPVSDSDCPDKMDIDQTEEEPFQEQALNDGLCQEHLNRNHLKEPLEDSGSMELQTRVSPGDVNDMETFHAESAREAQDADETMNVPDSSETVTQQTQEKTLLQQEVDISNLSLDVTQTVALETISCGSEILRPENEDNMSQKVKEKFQLNGTNEALLEKNDSSNMSETSDVLMEMETTPASESFTEFSSPMGDKTGKSPSEIGSPFTSVDTSKTSVSSSPAVSLDMHCTNDIFHSQTPPVFSFSVNNTLNTLPTTYISFTPKIGMGKPAITKRKFSPGRPRSRQGTWSINNTVSPPSWSPDGLEGRDLFKTRQLLSNAIWSIKVGRGSGFPGKRRPRGSALSGRGGRGRSKLKNGMGAFLFPGLNPFDMSLIKDEEENSMHTTVVLFSSSDRFTLYQDMCVVCGSFGQGAEGRLLACSQCGQCYHPFCVNIKLTKVILKKGWRCLECTVCEACGKATDPGRLLLCDDCDISYHTYCLDPPLQTVPKGGWKCKWCVWCTNCRALTPGLRCEWQNNYTQCAPCASLSTCPVCFCNYKEQEIILQCRQCDRWLHACCQSLNTEEEVENAADSGFDCTMCRPYVTPTHVPSSDGCESPVVAHIVTKVKEPEPPKTFTQDGVCLTESGLSHLQGLTVSVPRKKRSKPKLKLKIINQNSVAVLQTPPEIQSEHSRDGEIDDSREGELMDCDVKSDSSPERECAEEDIKGIEIDGIKKKKRKPYRPGIGGFMVRQRSRTGQGKAKRSLSRKDSSGSISEQRLGLEDGWSEQLPGTPIDECIPGSDSTEKIKKRYRKKKNKLEETFPSYLQEAFFGKHLLDSSRQKKMSPYNPLEDPSQHLGKAQLSRNLPDLSSDPFLSSASSLIPLNQKLQGSTQDQLSDLSETLNTDDDLLGMFSDDLVKAGTRSAGLDIGLISDDSSSLPQPSASQSSRPLSEEQFDGILSPELDKMVTDDAMLGKLYKIPELEGKDVEDLFTAVLSPITPRTPPLTQLPPHPRLMPLHNHGGSVFPRMPLVNGIIPSRPHLPHAPVTSGPALGTFSPIAQLPYGDNRDKNPPFSSLMNDNNSWNPPAPVVEGEGDTMSNAQRSTLKWEKEEALGEMATVAPVLYANVNFSNLKEEFPDWSTRAKQIAKLWRKASSQERAPYVQKARENRTALRINKVQLSNDSMKRQQQQEIVDPTARIDHELFKDPLRQRESEHEQEWKFRQQMRQKSKQQAKIEATQKLEQVKSEQQQQQQQQFGSQQHLSQSDSDTPTSGVQSPLTPQQGNGSISPAHPTFNKELYGKQHLSGMPSSTPADDVFLKPQAPPPTPTKTQVQDSLSLCHVSQPLSPQMFSPGSRPSSPMDPYAKMVGTPRPLHLGPHFSRRNSLPQMDPCSPSSGVPRLIQGNEPSADKPSPIRDSLCSSPRSGEPYEKTPDSPKPVGISRPITIDQSLKSASLTGGNEIFPRLSVRTEPIQKQHISQARVIQDSFTRPHFTSNPTVMDGSPGPFKTPQCPPKSPQESHASVLTAPRHAVVDSFERSTMTPRPLDSFSKNAPSDPYSHQPLTPRPTMNDTFSHLPRVIRLHSDNFSQSGSIPRPMPQDQYIHPPGTTQSVGDVYSQPPSTPRPTVSDTYAQQPLTTRPPFQLVDPYSQSAGGEIFVQPQSHGRHADRFNHPPGKQRRMDDPSAQPLAKPQPQSDITTDPYSKSPGTLRPDATDLFTTMSGSTGLGMGDDYSCMPGTPRPGIPENLIQHSMTRPGVMANQDSFFQSQQRRASSVQESFARQSVSVSCSQRTTGSTTSDSYSHIQLAPPRDPYDQPPMTPRPHSGDNFGSNQISHESVDLQRPGSDGGFTKSGNSPISSQGQQFNSTSHVPGPRGTSISVDSQNAINLPQADTEEKLRQRQKLRERLLLQQQNKNAGRQEKGLENPTTSPHTGPPPSWQHENLNRQNELFSRPPPPYPGNNQTAMQQGSERFLRPQGSERFSVAPTSERFAIVPNEQCGPFPVNGQFNRPLFAGDVSSIGPRPHGQRFSFTGGGYRPAPSQERFFGPPLQMQAPGATQQIRPLPFNMPRPVNNLQLNNIIGHSPHYPPYGMPVQQHNISGQAYIELRHRPPDARLRLIFPPPGANRLEAATHHQRHIGFIHQQEFPGPRLMEPIQHNNHSLPGPLQVPLHVDLLPESRQTQMPSNHPHTFRSENHEHVDMLSDVPLSRNSPPEAAGDVQLSSQAAEEVQEKIDPDDPSVKDIDVKDLDAVEVKDLDDEDLENLNLDPEDGKGDELDTLDNIETNDPNLDDLLRSEDFDIIAYTAGELDLGDKRGMFSEELDLNVPVDVRLDMSGKSEEPKSEQQNKVANSPGGNSSQQKMDITDLKTEMITPNSQEQQKRGEDEDDSGAASNLPSTETGLNRKTASVESGNQELSDDRIPETAKTCPTVVQGPSSLATEGIIMTGSVTRTTAILTDSVSNETSDHSETYPLGSPQSLTPVHSNKVSSVSQTVINSPGQTAEHAKTSKLTMGPRPNCSFSQGTTANPVFMPSQLIGQTLTFGTVEPANQSTSVTSLMGPNVMPSPQQIMLQQNRERPLLLEEQPLLLQDLLDQERQEQQQQRQMQAMIRQRSEPFFPNIDFDAITDPIMKAKMVALKGINKVMAQNNMGIPPIVMNRFPFINQQMSGTQSTEGRSLLQHGTGQEGGITPQMIRPNPPNFGPGFVNDSQKKQYEEWLQETQQLLQMQQKFLEEQIGAHRKSKKALSAKQRTAKKAGRELPEEDAEQLKHVIEQQTMVQKQLEQIRKQQKEHAELIEEYRIKQQQQQCTIPTVATVPVAQPHHHPRMTSESTPATINQHIVSMPQQLEQNLSLNPGQMNPVRITNIPGWQSDSAPRKQIPLNVPRMPPPVAHIPANPETAVSSAISSANAQSNAPPRVEFDDNNPFSESFQERERKERLREQQERQRIQLMQEVDRQRALQQKLEMDQRATMGSDLNERNLTQIPFFTSDLPCEFLQPSRGLQQSPQQRQQIQQSMQQGSIDSPPSVAYMQSNEQGRVGPSLYGHDQSSVPGGSPNFSPMKQSHGSISSTSVPQARLLCLPGMPNTPPGNGSGPFCGQDTALSHTLNYPGSNQSLVQLYSDIIPEENVKKKRRKKKKDDDADSVRTPSTPHSDFTAPPTPVISDSSSTPAVSVHNESAQNKEEHVSSAQLSSPPNPAVCHPSSELELHIPSSDEQQGVAQQNSSMKTESGLPQVDEPSRMCDIKLECTEGDCSPLSIEPKEENSHDVKTEGKVTPSSASSFQNPERNPDGVTPKGESGNELLKHLLKNKKLAEISHSKAEGNLLSEKKCSPEKKCNGKKHSLPLMQTSERMFHEEFENGQRQAERKHLDQDKKKMRNKRVQKTGEKATPRAKKRKKDEEQKPTVFPKSENFAKFKQHLSLLPLMEPILGVNFAHFLPYGSGQLNGGTHLLGTFGNATLDGVSDYYSQLIYKVPNFEYHSAPAQDFRTLSYTAQVPQNNLSNPPTPPASLPPTPPPQSCHKMVNGFATTEELAGKAVMLGGRDVTRAIGHKQFHLPFRPHDDLFARAIANYPRTVDIPASLPTPPHNYHEEMRTQDHNDGRDTPESFVPSSSPESVVGMEISRYPDLLLVKEEPPDPASSPVIPLLPSSTGKGSEVRQNDVKTEASSRMLFFGSQFMQTPNSPKSGLISVAVTLHPTVTENIDSVVAAVADLLHVRIPNNYEVSGRPEAIPVGLMNNKRITSDLEYRQHIFLHGNRVGSMTSARNMGSYGLKQANQPFNSANNVIPALKDQHIVDSPGRRHQWCRHCKVVVLGGGVRKSLGDLPLIKQEHNESLGLAENDIVFCSNNCFLLHSSQIKHFESKEIFSSLKQSILQETSPKAAFHQYSNNISTLDVHCLPQLHEKVPPSSSPPINFPPAGFETTKVEAKPDKLKVTVKLKPKMKAVHSGFEDLRPPSKKWKGMKWKKWNIQIVIPKGIFKTQCEGELDEFINKLGTSLKPDPLPRDYRKCCFCHTEGDGHTNGPARLLNLDLDVWVHLNCALWSTEVYETQAGALINVELALRRGMQMKCVLCHKMGATSGCHRLRCTNIYHFTCANKAQCMFFKDKTMLCPMHKPKGAHEQELNYFAVFRRVYVQRDEVRQIASIVQRGERDHTFRVGSLIFHTIGQLMPQQMHAFHSSTALFPVGYEASRLYWSMRYANRRCRYLCCIEEKDGLPWFVIRVVEHGHEDLVLSDATPKGVWDKVLEPVARCRKDTEILRLFPMYLKGEDLFGLTVSAVARIAESLPGVEACENYTFRYGCNPLMELPLSINPTGCTRSEPKTSSHVKRFVLRPHTLNSTSTSKSFQSTVTGELNAPYSKQFVHSKSSQYRKMKTEWKSNVYLARSHIQGLGLYAARDIEKHTMVIEYIGTIIRNEVANRKEKLYESQNRGVYMFRLDNDHVIDATLTGGPARYINHSCAPNCVAEVVAFEKGHKIIISSNRRIQKGEELCYDYKFDFEDDQHKIPCHCGAVNCRKWMN